LKAGNKQGTLAKEGCMLALTPTAAEVVNAIVSQEGSDSAGMRITSEASAAAANGAGPGRDVRLSVVDSPEADDEVIDGAPIYVEPGDTAELLDGKVLDADVHGEEVHFRLVNQR
jgi:Fe-S cluster assembly iron-binding protein IscA